jgi:hypothetical protein
VNIPPIHIPAEELLAFALDQEPLNDGTQQHLVDCSQCQREVGCYQSLATQLQTRHFREQCPSAFLLSCDSIPGILSSQEHEQITAHIAECPLCALELTETKQFLGDCC